MFDSSEDVQRATGHGACTGDVDSLYEAGFRDCAKEAVLFLTERAGFDPDDSVIQDIRGLLDGPAALHLPIVASTSTVDGNVCSDANTSLRIRRTNEQRENRCPRARRCLYGRVNRRQHHRVTTACLNSPTAALDDHSVPDTHVLHPSPPASQHEAATVRDVAGASSTVGGDGRRRGVLTTLQTTATFHRQSRTNDDEDEQCRRNVTVRTSSGVSQCASMLVHLAQNDRRVSNLLAELFQLMDAQ